MILVRTLLKVAFHINDVWVYKKPLLQYNSLSTSALLPVGEKAVHLKSPKIY